MLKVSMIVTFCLVLCCSDNCSTSIVDYFRSCDGGSSPCECTYDLCLTCCRELRAGLQPGGDQAESAQVHSEAQLTKDDMLEDEEDLPGDSAKHSPDLPEEDDDMQDYETTEKLADSSENPALVELADAVEADTEVPPESPGKESEVVVSEKPSKEEVLSILGDENASKDLLSTDPTEPEPMETEPKVAKDAGLSTAVDSKAYVQDCNGSKHVGIESTQQDAEVKKEASESKIEKEVPAEVVKPSTSLNPEAEEAESKEIADESIQHGIAGEANGEQIVPPLWAPTENGEIPCPPKMRGGCGCHTLRLKSLFEHNWVTQLINDVEEQLKDYKELEKEDKSCSKCAGGAKNTNVRLAAHRADNKENYVYCPTLQDTEQEGISHFQKHWRQGQPVIVRNVLEGASGLSWEPLTMWRALRETTQGKFKDDSKTVRAIDCSDLSEVSCQQFCRNHIIVLFCFLHVQQKLQYIKSQIAKCR